MCRLELEAADLRNGYRILRHRCSLGCIWDSNVADYTHIVKIILHDLTGQGGRCRLSVRSGDCDQSAFSKIVSKLDFSPDGNILCTKTLHHRKIRRNSRA